MNALKRNTSTIQKVLMGQRVAVSCYLLSSSDNVLSRLRSRVVGVRVRSLAVYSQQEGERQLLGSSDEGKVVLIRN
jgi:hypothetical protein